MLFSLGIHLDSYLRNYIGISLQLSNINFLGKLYDIIMCFIIIRKYRRATAELSFSKAKHCLQDQFEPSSLQWDSASITLKHIIFRWLISSRIDNYRTFSRDTQLNEFWRNIRTYDCFWQYALGVNEFMKIVEVDLS